jgi:hypothetical protein
MTLSYQPPITKAKLLPIVKEIVYWENEKGTESHCLARIFEEEGQQIVMLSEIRSNVVGRPRHPGIFYDFATPGNVLAQKYPEKFNSPNDRILWIAHSGNFSDFETMYHGVEQGFDIDRFYQVEMHYVDGKFSKAAGRMHQLKWEEKSEVLGHIDIENIYEICKEIGWEEINPYGDKGYTILRRKSNP